MSSSYSIYWIRIKHANNKMHPKCMKINLKYMRAKIYKDNK